MARSSRARIATGAIALVAAAALVACSPITTNEQYAASDGVLVSLGDDASPAVTGENVLVVSEAEGEPGVVIGALTNRTDGPRSVTVSLDGVALTIVRVDAGETVTIGTESGPQIDIPAVPAPPGAVTDLGFETPEDGAVTVAVPVLDGTLPEYADLLPAG
ncbi:putative lipoprotein [Beutenbergia cavernae DSM 12333]|uniref:Putative lipoprotein n=1 Tax=Beutenbergia cavernae (strain ATCC BAA-8 / DSM 12333 / CCUG 43141 / JCM 11478 / NBRC 16432 / NCIMB 13614 / HKI 0122) TaxID=471853 RepID=C5BYS5_BEUC1|nr:hypothetical protein [Beutenbergia cavernae]ACQ79033.1 putative lipoprotein [Beutenbergia cavernae DSM 12333]